MKSYTDLEQSRKLAEFLPLENADMCYVIDYAESNIYGTDHFKLEVDTYGLKARTRDNIPCWSLVALLGVIPNYQLQTQDDGIGIICSCNGNFNIVTANNAVDACYEMILKLHELKML